MEDSPIYKTKKFYKRIEDNLQKACITWFNCQYPHQSKLLHANNNNTKNRDAWKGKVNKDMGVRSGVSDLEYIRGGRVYFIELKTDVGRQTDEQKEFQKQVEAEGLPYLVVRNLEEFIEVIKQINQ